jgi:hypothetical protein
MPTEAKDEFMVYLTGGGAQPRHCFNRQAVDRALDELGRTFARVRRVTEGELARDVTHTFQTIEPDYPDDDTATRRWNGERRQHFAFGKMVR